MHEVSLARWRSRALAPVRLAQPDSAPPTEPDSSLSKLAPAKKAAGPADQAWFDGLVAQLDADDYATRAKASTELSTDDRVTLKMIEARLTDAARPLAPEQGLRAFAGGDQDVRRQPARAMGVSFAGMDSRGGRREGRGAVDGFDAKPRAAPPGTSSARWRAWSSRWATSSARAA